MKNQASLRSWVLQHSNHMDLQILLPRQGTEISSPFIQYVY
jgi:hypothetical protein